MKGLILKDLYMVKGYLRAFLLIIVIFPFLSLLDESFSFSLYYPMVLAGIIPFSLISYDERSKWTQYCDTLPISRKTVVSARYISALLFILPVVLLAAIALTLQPNTSTASIAFTLSALSLIGLLCPSITMPLIFRFGSEKARIIYYLIIGGACAAGAILFTRLSFSAAPDISAPALILLPLSGIALFSLSWLLSIRIYEKREL